jgi:hypothetical protein
MGEGTSEKSYLGPNDLISKDASELLPLASDGRGPGRKLFGFVPKPILKPLLLITDYSVKALTTRL